MDQRMPAVFDNGLCVVHLTPPHPPAFFDLLLWIGLSALVRSCGVTALACALLVA